MCQRAPKINSVFFPYEEEKKVPKLNLYGGPPSYNPKVMIHDWQYRSPDENRCCRKIPRFGESTYKRLGPYDDPIGISATEASWREALENKNSDESASRYRSLLNLLSFPLTETEECRRALGWTDVVLPRASEPTDYRTTLRDDYPWHFPEKWRDPKSRVIPDPPWFLYRRIFGYTSDDLLRRSGVTKFLDDNFDVQNRAAAMKMPRFVSYNPGTGEYTDTKRHSEALLKNLSSQCSG